MVATYPIKPGARGLIIYWIAVLAGAVLVYALGLGGQYIPTNGDELVYAHIARVTAATHHWLPLASQLDNMRNTKPPLLFWQAMVAGGWAQSPGDWTLLALRLPSLGYTMLITAAVAWSVRLITRQRATALMAACLYLAFFSTFRYGRPYLTSAAETFWLDVPMFALLWWRSGRGHLMSAATGLGDSKEVNGALAPVEYAPLAIFNIANWIGIGLLIGVAWGLGSAYKSFALIAPAAAALWCAALLSGPSITWRTVIKTSVLLFGSAVLALGIFALWFVLDPDPAAVWREFVVGENVGKMGDKLGYWHEALYGGGSSLWAMSLAYVENAGLLAFVVLGGAWAGVQGLKSQFRSEFKTGFTSPVVRGTLAPHSATLWVPVAWLAVWLVVFALPSQRSARYVIPAMPALAILLALYWERIARGWFLASLGLIAVAALALGRVAWVMHDLGIATRLEMGLAVAMVGAVTGACLMGALAGARHAARTRALTLLACLALYASFGLTTAPLDGSQGRYDGLPRGSTAAGLTALPAQAQPNSPVLPAHALIAVPSNFNAQYERFEFLLPGRRFVPFDASLMGASDAVQTTLAPLLKTHDAVVWGQVTPGDLQPPCLPNCTVLARRWVVKERHRSGDITWANLAYPHTWLFSREWLLGGK